MIIILTLDWVDSSIEKGKSKSRGNNSQFQSKKGKNSSYSKRRFEKQTTAVAMSRK